VKQGVTKVMIIIHKEHLLNFYINS